MHSGYIVLPAVVSLPLLQSARTEQRGLGPACALLWGSLGMWNSLWSLGMWNPPWFSGDVEYSVITGNVDSSVVLWGYGILCGSLGIWNPLWFSGDMEYPVVP